MIMKTNRAIGRWKAFTESPQELAAPTALANLRKPVFAVENDERAAFYNDGQAILGEGGNAAPLDSSPLLAYAQGLLPQQLGEENFLSAYSLKYPYVQGSMANGIASADLVRSMANAGLMGFFGAAGLAPAKAEETLAILQKELKGKSFGCNLIHSPQDQALENAIANLYIKYGLHFIEASAYLTLTLPLLRYRYAGIHRDSSGAIIAPNRVMAKISRLEVARKFLALPPASLLQALVAEGSLTPEQAELAAMLPVASELTAEADSGGHTDNRPAISLIPSVIGLRDELELNTGIHIPVGAAGGISTPGSAAAAFAMGAAFIVTGSINQACQESGSCDYVRGLLAKAGPADVAMAPAADMFEMGVNVQVLKWGTMFPVKAKKLYELYKRYDSFEELPAEQKASIERDYLKSTFAEAWESTRRFFEVRDPRQIEKAEANPKHKLALVFRSYLGQASRWANAGIEDRKADYQIWCGPSMGSFNEWTKGSFLEEPKERRADICALNLLAGAAYMTRAASLRNQGVQLPLEAMRFRPHTKQELSVMLQENE